MTPAIVMTLLICSTLLIIIIIVIATVVVNNKEKDTQKKKEEEEEDIPDIIINPEGTVNIVGFYGNSYNEQGAVPRPPLSEIDGAYNIITFAFLVIDERVGNVPEGELIAPYLNMSSGPYVNANVANANELNAAIIAWKAIPDEYGRQKHAIISIGGANRVIPPEYHAPGALYTVFKEFLNVFHAIDGMDCDMETHVADVTSYITPAFAKLKTENYFLTAAPEVAEFIYEDYAPLIPLLNIWGPQFYNSPTNSLDWNNLPQFTDGPAQPPEFYWDPIPEGFVRQEKLGVVQMWCMGIAERSLSPDSMDVSRISNCILVPATNDAAGSQNHYPMSDLAQNIKLFHGIINSVGTWSIEFDARDNYPFATNMRTIMTK